jgi:hypothetical protein
MHGFAIHGWGTEEDKINILQRILTLFTKKDLVQIYFCVKFLFFEKSFLIKLQCYYTSQGKK